MVLMIQTQAVILWQVYKEEREATEQGGKNAAVRVICSFESGSSVRVW